MAKKSVAVLDVRSSEVSVFVGERGINNTFVFKASATEPYGGYENGEFYDIADLSDAVHRALNRVEQVCGGKTKTLYVGVPGEFTRILPKKQAIGFAKKTKITEKEIDALFKGGEEEIEGYRCMRATSMIYITADNRRVSDPTGLVSTGLSGVLSYFYYSIYFQKAIEGIFGSAKINLRFLPTQLAMATYLIPPETRDEYAVFLDIGYLSSTVSVVLGNGVLEERTIWAGKGQIAFRLMEAFSLPYDVAVAVLDKANLFSTGDSGVKEFNFRDKSYNIPVGQLVEEVKAGLDELCEHIGAFLEDCSGKELDNKPLYVTGEGTEGIRGALEHMTKRLSYVCEQVVPDLPFYNQPRMSSRIALTDMAYEDNRKSGYLYRLLNVFGG